MRRSRHKLKVDTFPFLAVLLCAMGSLILLLLVMDRRAKIVARNRISVDRIARQTELEQRQASLRAALEAQVAQAAAEAAQSDAERLAAWQRQRDAVRADLERQHQTLRLEASSIQQQAAQHAQSVTQEAARIRLLQEQVEKELAQLRTERSQLEQRQATLSAQDPARSAVSAQQRRLSAELEQLERTLKDLKDLKSRERPVYSLVPYKGKRGDARKPTYVECAADAITLHPGRLPLTGDLHPAIFREELQKRTGPFGLEKVIEVGAKETRPYVLFLVRPEGIAAYYWAQSALKGWALDFGYELVEADWVFDFSADAQLAGQPWRLEAPTIGAPPPTTGQKTVPATVTGFRGPPGSGPPGSGGTSSQPPGGVAGGNGPFPGPGGGPPGAPRPGSTGNGSGVTLSTPVALGPPIPDQSTPGTSPRIPGSGDGADPSKPGMSPRIPGSDRAPTSPPDNPDPSKPGMSPRIPGSDRAPTSPPDNPDPSKPGMRPRIPGSAPPDGSAPQPGSDPQTAPPPAGSGDSKTPPRPDEEPGEPTPRLLAGMPDSGAKKQPRPIPLSRLTGNRDFIVVIECRADGAVLLLRNELYPTRTVTDQREVEQALVHVVKDLIDRRVASARPGEPPYRPQIRLKVMPDGLRTYYWAYPALLSLRVPMARENVEE